MVRLVLLRGETGVLIHVLLLLYFPTGPLKLLNCAAALPHEPCRYNLTLTAGNHAMRSMLSRKAIDGARLLPESHLRRASEQLIDFVPHLIDLRLSLLEHVP